MDGIYDSEQRYCGVEVDSKEIKTIMAKGWMTSHLYRASTSSGSLILHSVTTVPIFGRSLIIL